MIEVRDQKFSMKLQIEDGLTLEKAISTAHQQEYVKQEQATLKKDVSITGESVDHLRERKGGPSAKPKKHPAGTTTTCLTRCYCQVS